MNSHEKKSTAEMLLILTILNIISKQNTTNRVDKNDLVELLQQWIARPLIYLKKKFVKL